MRESKIWTALRGVPSFMLSMIEFLRFVFPVILCTLLGVWLGPEFIPADKNNIEFGQRAWGGIVGFLLGLVFTFLWVNILSWWGDLEPSAPPEILRRNKEAEVTGPLSGGLSQVNDAEGCLTEVD